MRQIELREVSRAYGRSFALHRVSLTLRAGELWALLGGNGAGKSTLLTMLATLEPPTRGQLLYDELPWGAMARRGRRHIGWVGHDTLLYNDLSGLENLLFYAKMYHIPDPRQQVQRWLERVELEEAARRRVATYSRGMMQRLTLARALLHEPELLLLDEPLTGLDQDGKRVVHEVLSERRDRGCLIVMSTHELLALDGLCTHAAVLKRGRLASAQPVGSAQELMALYEAHA